MTSGNGVAIYFHVTLDGPIRGKKIQTEDGG